MRAVNVQNFRYAKKGRRYDIPWRLILWPVLFILILLGIGYFLFYSGTLSLTLISVDGVNGTLRTSILEKIQEKTDKKAAFLTPYRNLLFFPNKSVVKDILSSLPDIKSITLEKKYPHSMVIKAAERKSLGIWCFNNKDKSKCQYFDNDGVFWGDTLKSSGYLVMLIEDQRVGDLPNVDERFFKVVKSAITTLPSIGLTARKAIIPKDSTGEFEVYVDREYKLIFNLDSDIAAQIAVLKIFLDDRLKDPTFKPLVIDLSIDGRVYYK